MLKNRCLGLVLVGCATASLAWGDTPPPPAPATDLGASVPMLPPAPHPPSPQAGQPQPIAPIPQSSATPAQSDSGAAHWTSPSPISPGTPGAGPAAGWGAFAAPGGYEARIGSPYYYHSPGGGQYVVTGNPYYDHFGPGFQRHSLQGHYRFPYYNYRAPWYYPGRAVYNRDTNFPW